MPAPIKGVGCRTTTGVGVEGCPAGLGGLLTGVLESACWGGRLGLGTSVLAAERLQARQIQAGVVLNVCPANQWNNWVGPRARESSSTMLGPHSCQANLTKKKKKGVGVGAGTAGKAQAAMGFGQFQQLGMHGITHGRQCP